MRNNIIILLLLLILTPVFAHAKTVLLKNGIKMNAEKVWEENGQIKCFINGLVVSFPKKEIKEVINDDVIGNKTMSESWQTKKSTVNNTVYDIDTVKKRLRLKDNELDKEFKKLMSENKKLAREKKYFKSKNKMLEYNEKIIQYNENVKRYEQKRAAYEAEARAFCRWMEKTSVKTPVNVETLSIMATSWIGRDIETFIDQWGNPDKIIKNPDKNDRYIFNLNIPSSNMIKIFFSTGPSGKITDYQTEKITPIEK